MGYLNDHRSTVSLVERYIGTEYDKIQEIADNLPALLELLAFFKSHTGVTDERLIFAQSVAGTVWSIQHNMQKHPSVQTVDEDLEEIEGEVTYIDDMFLKIVFNQPVSGFAYLN
jgi:hypothetical protein